MDQAITKMLVRLHGVEATQQAENAVLGVTPTTVVQMKGVPIKVMIDAGSPVTIISLAYLLATLAKGQPNGESLAQWQRRVKDRLQPMAMHLRSYSGNELPIFKQIRVQLLRDTFATEAWIQVQKDAPVDILLGTDIQPLLAFHLMQMGPSGKTTDLLGRGNQPKGGEKSTPFKEQPLHRVHISHSRGRHRPRKPTRLGGRGASSESCLPGADSSGAQPVQQVDQG